VKVSSWVWAKSAGFTHNKAGKDACAPHFQMHGTHARCARRMWEREKSCPRRMDGSSCARHIYHMQVHCHMQELGF